MDSTNSPFLLSADKFELPQAIKESPGIAIGKQIVHSVLLSTDLSYIQNMDFDAIMAIHPFAPSGQLNSIIIDFCERPVFCSIGGGFRDRHTAAELSEAATVEGAEAVVVTKPTSPEVIEYIHGYTHSNLVYTILHEGEDIHALVEAGVDMFNVSTGETTASAVRRIRTDFPDIPIMANGGPFESTIIETIESGADAIVYNPPTATEMMRAAFDEFRRG
jgi:hypothetical protein